MTKNNGHDPKIDAEHLADDRLVDAMLKGHYRDTPKATAQRITRACRALEISPRLVAWHWKAGLSTAAAAIVVLGLTLMLISPQNVQADLTPVLAAFDRGDRTYSIDISVESNKPVHRRGFGNRRFERRPPFRSPRRGMSALRLDGASLYTRGRHYLLTCGGPRGGSIHKGFDGHESWLVMPWGKSIRGQDHSLLQTEIPDHISSLLFLDLRDTLHKIQKNYTLSGPSLGTLENGFSEMEYYIAELNDRQSKKPRLIELWFDVASDQLEQILCTGVSMRNPKASRYNLQINLVDTEPLPGDWFTQAAHIQSP